MDKNDFKNENQDSEQISKFFKEEEYKIKLGINNCLIYGEKNDFNNEDIFFKQKEAIDPYNLDNKNSSIDLNLTEKNLHEFLNDDLIKALEDEDLIEPQENGDLSDSSSSNAYISVNSECTTKPCSPEPNIKFSNKDTKDLNMKLNENSSNQEFKDFNVNKNSENVNNNSNINMEQEKKNVNNENNINKINNNKEKVKEGNNNINFKDKIEMLNDPSFAPLFILPEKMDNLMGESKEIKKKEFRKEKMEIKKEKKNSSLKNKFDDNVEPTIMLSMINTEEKTKLPSEIRVGDWICLYCNNLNFSFRIKCNRCGLLRKSSTHLLKKKFHKNKYQCMWDYNNNEGEIYFNHNNIYDLNYNSNTWYNNDM